MIRTDKRAIDLIVMDLISIKIRQQKKLTIRYKAQNKSDEDTDLRIEKI